LTLRDKLVNLNDIPTKKEEEGFVKGKDVIGFLIPFTILLIILRAANFFGFWKAVSIISGAIILVSGAIFLLFLILKLLVWIQKKRLAKQKRDESQTS
jgi:membrane protein YdbS with pleckstrin-like domain